MLTSMFVICCCHSGTGTLSLMVG